VINTLNAHAFPYLKQRHSLSLHALAAIKQRHADMHRANLTWLYTFVMHQPLDCSECH
jgi:hypothetical protein